MREEFEKMVSAGKLKPEHVDPLVEMATSGFCLHRKWGCGRITTVDTVFGRLTIDFPDKPGHSMDMGFAAGLLQPIPSDHIMARKLTDSQGLKQLAALNHLELIKITLQSFGGSATLDQIQQTLVPEIISDDWKKWWEAAKKELKKDGHFIIPIKKNDPIVYQSEETPLRDRLLNDFQNAKGLKAKLTVAQEFLKSIEELEDGESALVELIGLLNAEIFKYQKNQPALALEGVFMRDELQAQLPAHTPDPDEVTAASIWNQAEDLTEILLKIPAAKHKTALQSFRSCFPEDWHTRLLEILNSVPTRLCSECARLLIEAGHLDELKQLLAKLISQHQASSDFLLWLAKERTDAFADILTPEVFRAMLTSIERDQFNEKRSNKLADFILQDPDLLVELVEYADIEIIKDVTRALQISNSFDDVDRRSLLARLVKQYPAVQSLITGEDQREANRLVVSWESLERRRKEYETLVKKKIPANSKEIALARSYGDLRENHEYKSAKEMQKLLMKRKTELEVDLARAQGTDFLDVGTETVGIGCVIEVTDLASEGREKFTILGAWDLDMEHHIISYLSPLAQAALNRKVGDEIEFDMGHEHKRYRIESISPARTSENISSQRGEA